MIGGHWQHRLLGITACGADPAPAGILPAAIAAPTDPEQIGCLRCSIAVKAALRRARERGYSAASPDDALALQ